jgi:type IV pilus assembly protein PilV
MVKNIQSGRRRNGFTLIEVLVTVIVLAIGILGLAGLQLAGMRSNFSAYQRTQAILAASDLIDRMRVSPAAFTGAAYSTSTATEIDAFDRWAAALAARLPAPDSGAQGSVDCAAGNGCQAGNCQIVIRWDDARAEDGTVAQPLPTASGQGTDTPAGRSPGAMSFSVCTRLPETT